MDRGNFVGLIPADSLGTCSSLAARRVYICRLQLALIAYDGMQKTIPVFCSLISNNLQFSPFFSVSHAQLLMTRYGSLRRAVIQLCPFQLHLSGTGQLYFLVFPNNCKCRIDVGTQPATYTFELYQGFHLVGLAVLMLGGTHIFLNWVNSKLHLCYCGNIFNSNTIFLLLM